MFLGAIIYLNLMTWGCFAQGEQDEHVVIEDGHVVIKNKQIFVVIGPENLIYGFIDPLKVYNLSEGFAKNDGTLKRIKRSPRKDLQQITNGPCDCNNKKHQIKQATATIQNYHGTKGNFADDFLKAHNDYRALHGVGPLTLDPKLSEQSQKWADYLAQTDTFEHSSDNNYGENLYASYPASEKINGIEPVKAWYDEIVDYTYGGNEDDNDEAGHFTQVVWKGSQKLGIGVAQSKSSTKVVANYDPAGNYQGEYDENVPQLIKQARRSRLLRKADKLRRIKIG